jgi:ABC-type multidrug transport system ATPase subunit
MTGANDTRERARADGTAGAEVGEEASPEATSGPDRDATAGAPSVVTLDGVEKQFGDVTVLNGVTAQVPRGSVTAVVGPNGAGKTTLIRTVAGLLRPDAGTVSVDADTPRAVGYLPQSPRFREPFTIAETLSFYASLVDGGIDAGTAIERVGLEAVRDRQIGALSGGMVRLVGLAQALLGDPAVLVLDEPTSSLDPAMTDYVAGVIADLVADADRTVLLATHDLTVAGKADRLVLLDRGEIVTTSTPEAFQEAHGGGTLTEAFVDAVGTGRTVRAGAPPAVDEDRDEHRDGDDSGRSGGRGSAAGDEADGDQPDRIDRAVETGGDRG